MTGWFHKEYGKDAHPILPIDLFDKIYRGYGAKAAKQTLRDVQDGRRSIKAVRKYFK